MILIKYASKLRPTEFIRAMNNIRTMTKTEFKVIVSCDAIDRTMNNEPMINRVKSDYPFASMYFGPSQGKVAAINRDMDKAGEWNILVNFSDDMVFRVRGWDVVLRKRISSTWTDSDWFAHFNDGYIGKVLPTMSIMGYDYYQRFGYIYHPSYKSFSCDAEAMCVAIQLGKYRYFPDVLFKHEHPANNRRLKGDRLYQINSRYGIQDTTNYFKRLNKYFDQDPDTMPVSFKQHVGRKI